MRKSNCIRYSWYNKDVIEDTINIQGLTFRLIDTAGIRDTHTDEIESLGVSVHLKIEQANIVLWVADCETINEHIEELSQKILPVVGDRKLILIFNKVDIISAEERKAEKRKASIQ